MIWLVLLALLGVTFLVGELVGAGRWNLVIAMSIAATKALLIVRFFMHVRYSPPLTRLVACSGFFFLSVLRGLALCNDAPPTLIP